MDSNHKNKDERYLNVTFKNEEEDKDEVVISLSGIFKKLKKYFLVWIVTAVVAAMLIFSGTAIFKNTKSRAPLTALVGFTYKGIEEGLDPAGNNFDINTIKNPTVIQTALTELDLPLENLEAIRRNISFEPVIPSDAIDKITVYKSIYESGSMTAAQSILDTKYYPTQYKASFNYASAGFDNEDGVQIFNTILECYRNYFFETYGYNEALGSVVESIDYNDYDYSEAIDIFDTTLSSVETYLNQLAKRDTTRFRSSITGYTFSDLSETVKTLKDMDLQILSSYIIINNVTKDKETLTSYYQFKIDTLSREKTVQQEKLKSLTESIDKYQKDSVMVYGDKDTQTNSSYVLASEEYDNLIQNKIDTQTALSRVIQNIDYYNQRLTTLKSKPVANDAQLEKVENDFKTLTSKVNTLINDVNATANDYYETVSFANAYNILVPASSSTIVSTAKHIINTSMFPIAIAEVLLLVAYIGVSFVTAIIAENKKKALEADVTEEDTPESDEKKSK